MIDAIEQATEALRPTVRRGDWEELELAFAGPVHRFGGISPEVIRSTCRGHEDALARMLEAGQAHASRSTIAAGYWEFDMDNDWSSALFLCQSYRHEDEPGSDDWASDFDDDGTIMGPALVELATHYDPEWNGERAAALNTYLIACALATFGRAASRVWRLPVPLTAGFHDQDTVFRLGRSRPVSE